MKETVRIVRFMLAGTLNALITAIVIWVSMDLLDCNYLWSNVAGYTAALVNNFFWCKYWIFPSGAGNFRREIPLFLLAFGCAYGVQFLSLLVMVEGLGLDEYLSQFLGLFIYGSVNFIMNRRITFRANHSEK